MRFAKGKGNGKFEDRTSPREQAKHFPLDEADKNASRLNKKISGLRREKRTEGLQDTWVKMSRSIRKDGK